MLLTIPNVLNDEELAVAHDLLGKGDFVDGRLSAGDEARAVKHNLELDGRDANISMLNNLVMGNLVKHPMYQNAAMPLKIASPYYAKYTSGMAYGDHIDDPLMGPGQQRYRSDVATTIFLNAPDEYDGGELIIGGSFGERSVKLDAGSAVVYSASSTHRVNEVTRGERLVAVTWCQSVVRDAAQRELLYNLMLARDSLIAEDAEADTTRRVSNAYTNLVRMWAEV